MTRTGDQAFIKELNKSIVLNLLRFNSPISRAQISSQTGLNKATVSSIVDELIQDELVLEVGHGHTHVGRKPVLLLFNAKAGHVIGVDLGVDYFRVILADLSAQVIHSEQVALEDSRNLQHVLSVIIETTRAAISHAPASKLGVIGVGIGVPGLVDFSRGIVLNAPNLHWRDVHLRALMENYLSIPVFVDNEANAGALGEKLFGAARQVSNLVYISAGIGIGTGVIMKNELVRGSQGIAGEFGHMTIEAQGLKCSCGNHGCLEMYASEKALVQKYEQLTGRHLSSEQIIRRLSNNDPAALESVQAIGQYLGIGVSNILNGLNPSMILIGNRLGEANDWIIRPIEQTVQARCFTAPYTRAQVTTSTLGRNACAIGAASLVVHEYFAGPKTA